MSASQGAEGDPGIKGETGLPGYDGKPGDAGEKVNKNVFYVLMF